MCTLVCLLVDVCKGDMFNFALEDTIRRVQVNQDGLKLNGTHHLLVDNLLGGSVHTIIENAEALVVASREPGLEVNADKTKHMVMSRDQNAGRGHSMEIDNSSIEGWKSSNIWEQC